MMTDNTDNTDNNDSPPGNANQSIAAANVRPSKSISAVWFIPLVAVFVGGWMVFYSWYNLGPLVTITFKTAEGLAVDTTLIKLREITVGKIVDLKLTDDLSAIVASARLDKNAVGLLKNDTKFWIVKPRIGKSGISGLSTLLSGSYIEVSPGVSKKYAIEFVGLETPPVTPIGTPGRHITLNSEDKFAYSAGDPIIYKGLTVGRIEDVYFNFEERVVYYNAFVNAPYHELVTENTRFWNVGGMRLDLKADGVSLQIASLESLLSNSVTFDVPPGMPRGEPIEERHFYKIHPSYDAAIAARFNSAVEYVVLVSDSIRGLNVGAPVEYRGLRIGDVVNTNIFVKQDRTILNEDIKIPVLIRLQPGLANLPDNEEGMETLQKQIDHWIKSGLRASLQAGNLLTGSLFVELQHYPETVNKLEHFADYTVIPTQRNALTQIVAKASSFLDNLNKLPFDKLSDETRTLIAQLSNTVVTLRGSSESLTQILNDAENQQLPKKLADALVNFSRVTQDYAKGSSSYDELNDTLKSLTEAFNELQPLLQQLNNKPDSLIFSGAKKETLQPKKYRESGENNE